MTTRGQIKEYLATHPEPKRSEMQALHRSILAVMPKCKLRFLDGRDETGKIVSNPTIGYGTRTMRYADGTTKEFFQIGLSANTAGISVYILGIEDKKYLTRTYGKGLGKASVRGTASSSGSLRIYGWMSLKTRLGMGSGRPGSIMIDRGDHRRRDTHDRMVV